MSDNPVMTEYAGRMTSLSSSIIDAIKAVQASKHEVLAVDFATLWLVPNLYFLSLMAAQKTRVRQIAFMDSRIEPDRFVCFSSPDAILIALETHFPSLREAATLAQFEQNRSDVGQAAGMNFFGSLQQVYNKTPAGATERAVRVTPESLLWLLGSEAHRETVQWASPPKEKQYKAVLESGSEFVAALEGNQLLFLVSRERVALAVARAVQDAN
jgi:hypothetical protein